ncbi:expressed unknown protein [Seminavis robusta]|uniref:Uncharacterized protein n=1 Tax=Seminavis robusta TaxID=568900 RepID=A0A9N8HE48_9STRA|nr:expressed unknown protein [Seminavis robusta]|eukprot:Sro495_g154540.1 n/a (211) ;mRNA; f:59556-60188
MISRKMVFPSLLLLIINWLVVGTAGEFLTIQEDVSIEAPTLVYHALLQNEDALPIDQASSTHLRASVKPRESSWLVSDSEDDRNLQGGPTFSDEFSISFRLVWSMAFSEGTTIREPTQDEYNGLLFATLRWLLASANEAYADESDSFSVKSFDMTHYGASFNESDPFPSIVGMECSCILNANDRADIPSTIQFLVAFSRAITVLYLSKNT